MFFFFFFYETLKLRIIIQLDVSLTVAICVTSLFLLSRVLKVSLTIFFPDDNFVKADSLHLY